MTRIFEGEQPDELTPAASESPHDLAEWIRAAWQSGDAWLKACAVHSSRFAPDLGTSLFALEDGESEVVRAEVEARLHKDRARLPALEPRTAAG